MWGTKTPKKRLIHCDKGVGILNLILMRIRSTMNPTLERREYSTAGPIFSMTRDFSKKKG